MGSLHYNIMAILTLILGIGAIFFIKIGYPRYLSQGLFYIIPTIIFGAIFLVFGLNKTKINKDSDRALKTWPFYLITFVFYILQISTNIFKTLGEGTLILMVMLIGTLSIGLFILSLVFILTAFSNKTKYNT